MQKELLSSGCVLLLLEPSKEVQNVLKGALTTAVSCVHTDLEGHLSEIVATENNPLRDVVVPLLSRESQPEAAEQQ